MRVYLTIHAGGHRGTVTGFEPELKKPVGSHRRAVYCKPGDWLLWRNVCEEGIKAMLGIGTLPPPLTPIKFDLSAELLEDAWWEDSDDTEEVE